MTRWGIISRGVMFWWIFYWLAKVWYHVEIDTQGYDTPGRLTRLGMIPWGDWLTRVWYHGESDSPAYDALGSQIFGLKIRITLRIFNRNRKYFNPLVSSQGWFEWWKKLEVENLVGLSLEDIFTYIFHFAEIFKLKVGSF